MAGRLRTTYEPLKADGAKYITIMVEDASRGSTPTQATLDKWITKYACGYDVVIGSLGPLASGGTIGLPYNIIIDPRTMKIEKIVPGDGATVESTVKALITRNKK